MFLQAVRHSLRRPMTWQPLRNYHLTAGLAQARKTSTIPQNLDSKEDIMAGIYGKDATVDPSFKVKLLMLFRLKSKLTTEQIDHYERHKKLKKDKWSRLDTMSEEEQEKVLKEATDEQIKNIIGRTGWTILAFVMFGFFYYLNEFGIQTMTEYDDSTHPVSIFNRANYYSKKYVQSLVQPIQETLLSPLPVIPAGYMDINPKYTFVFEPMHILVSTQYDINNHYQYKKRKGLDRLLEKCLAPDPSKGSPFNAYRCETIFWTQLSDFENQEWMASLTKGRAQPLFRSACYYKLQDSYLDILTKLRMGYYLKCIDKLGRNMKKTILFDTDPRIVAAYPENALLMKKADTNHKDDRTLYDLAGFLSFITSQNLEDVRPIVAHYNKFGEDWLDEFVKWRNQRMLEIEKAKTSGPAEGQKPPAFRSASRFLSR